MVCYLFFINAFIKQQNNTMNLKRTFGAILTVLGIIGLIFTGVSIINHSGVVTTLVVVGVIAILFFFTGISLVRTTKDEV